VGSFCLAWNRTPTEELHLLFREVFRGEDVEESDVRQAAAGLLKAGGDFMPTPGKLLQGALEIQRERARAKIEKQRAIEEAERHEVYMKARDEHRARFERALPGVVKRPPELPKRVQAPLVPLDEDQWAERREKLLQQAKEILEPPKP